MHSVLRKEGMLDSEDEPELKEIHLSGLVGKQAGDVQGFVEYTPQIPRPQPLAASGYRSIFPIHSLWS